MDLAVPAPDLTDLKHLAHTLVNSDDTIDVHDALPVLVEAYRRGHRAADGAIPINLEEVKKSAFARALLEADGSPLKAARLLGVANSVFYRNVKKYGIKLPGRGADHS